MNNQAFTFINGIIVVKTNISAKEKALVRSQADKIVDKALSDAAKKVSKK